MSNDDRELLEALVKKSGLVAEHSGMSRDIMRCYALQHEHPSGNPSVGIPYEVSVWFPVGYPVASSERFRLSLPG